MVSSACGYVTREMRANAAELVKTVSRGDGHRSFVAGRPRRERQESTEPPSSVSYDTSWTILGWGDGTDRHRASTWAGCSERHSHRQACGPWLEKLQIARASIDTHPRQVSKKLANAPRLSASPKAALLCLHVRFDKKKNVPRPVRNPQNNAHDKSGRGGKLLRY